MSEKDPSTQTHINTGGGATLRDLQTQTFVGRDLILNLNQNFTGYELQSVLDQLLTRLRVEGVRVQNGVVESAGQEPLAIGAAQNEALTQYLAAASLHDQQRRVEHYLAHLCLRPQFQIWQQQYVTLSGGYRRQPLALDPHFSKILVRGDGPQREIERVQLEDIRSAMDEHPSLILLAQPGAGKTTVLRRLTLDLALKRLQDEGERLPLFVTLASQKPSEKPVEFLSRRWCEEMPGASESDFAQALRTGQLVLLCDALNEARRENYQVRADDWRDFAQSSA